MGTSPIQANPVDPRQHIGKCLYFTIPDGLSIYRAQIEAVHKYTVEFTLGTFERKITQAPGWEQWTGNNMPLSTKFYSQETDVPKPRI